MSKQEIGSCEQEVNRIMSAGNYIYDILNLDKNATESEVKKRYHKLSLIIHPDKIPDEDDHKKNPKEKTFKEKAEEAFKILNEAYQSYNTGSSYINSTENEFHSYESESKEPESEFQSVIKDLDPTTLRVMMAEAFLKVTKDSIINHKFKTSSKSEIRIPEEKAGSFTRKPVSRTAKQAYELVTEALTTGEGKSQSEKIACYEAALSKVFEVVQNRYEILSMSGFFTYEERGPSTAELYADISNAITDYFTKYVSREEEYPAP
jgi:DnaJ domain